MSRGARIRVSGRVQGVFFRNWTIEQAQALGLRGWVRNRADGSVEILAFGEEAALRALVAKCHEGPRAAQVARVEVEEAEGDAPVGFTRERTV
ncbi:acylphosphatase [Sphingomonas parva]|uniref:Acylphosphatase n=1 Tax=Sphingomonas parva TaxID=2555898 RepID=A0A4Y8ZRD4_9SPHN|nr:acylphosphatase [Sphingomonas parva]TFI58027.1 acylphosphatase [Sphingomonas parva]